MEVHPMTIFPKTGISSRRTKRSLLLAALGLTTTLSFTTGCATVRPHGVFSDPAPEEIDTNAEAETTPSSPVDPAKAVPESVQTPAVNPVGYTDEVVVGPLDEPASGLEESDPNAAPTSPDATLTAPDDTLTSFSDLIALNSNLAAIGSATTVADGVDVSMEQSNGITLEAIESIALSNNPTIGYNANQLADVKTDQHTVFISQTIITADKLQLNRNVLNEALRAQLLRLEAQKYRVATDIRITFYTALAAQRRLSLIRDFQSVADKGLELAELRKKGQEGSQLDVVQAEVQKNEIDLLLQQVEVRYQAAWRELAALAGRSEMQPVPLLGELPTTAADLDWQDVASMMVVSSPEYQAAQAKVSQARANITRQDVQKIPNLNLNLGTGSDQATGTGLINFVVSAPIPVFNKNQGNMSAALAEYIRACREVERVQNSIRQRLAVVSSDYGTSRVAVQRYSKLILPNAAETLKLAEIAYKAGETSFVQVLVARRTYFDTNLQYLSAQTLLAQSDARVDGYVLTGALNPVIDGSGNASLRGQALSQQ